MKFDKKKYCLLFTTKKYLFRDLIFMVYLLFFNRKTSNE